MVDYCAQITEVYEGPRVMSGVYPSGHMAYEKKVIYEDEDFHRHGHHHRHNPERVVMTEVEQIVEKPRHGYGEVIYEEIEAARYAEPRPTGYAMMRPRHHKY